MVLTNYWWLIIWLFSGGILLAYISFKQRQHVIGEKRNKWWFPSAILLVLPYVIWAGYRTDRYGDTYAYRAMFKAAPSRISELFSYVQNTEKDKGFSALMVLIKSIFGDSDIVFFLIIAIIQMLCIVYIYQKYSCNYWLSIFLFIASADYMSWMHNGMRQFLAVTISLISFEFLLRKRYVLVVGLILLATTVHASALLMLPAIFIIQGKAWGKKTICVLFATLVVILMMDRFTNVMQMLLVDTQYSDVVTTWQSGGDDGANPIRVLVYSIPTILSLIGLKEIRRKDNPIVNMAVNSGICATGVFCVSIFTSGIFVGRLPIYFYLLSQGIALPWLIENFFSKKSKYLVLIITVIFYLIYFQYQMSIIWKAI